MTGVARDDLPPPKFVLLMVFTITIMTRASLEGVVVGVAGPASAAFIDVAVGAVQPERGREEPHGSHELIHGDALQYLDVLEDLLRHRRPAGLRLPGVQTGAREGQHQPSATAKHARADVIGANPQLARSSGSGRGGVVHDAAADHGHHRLDVLDLIGGHREVIAVEDDEIGELARLDRAEIVLLEDEIGTAARVRDQRILAADGLRLTTVPPTILPVTANESVVNGRY